MVESTRVAAGGGAGAEVPLGSAAFLVKEAAEDAGDRDGVQGAEDGHLHHQTLQSLHAVSVSTQGASDAVDRSKPGRHEADTDGKTDEHRDDDELDKSHGLVGRDRRSADHAHPGHFVGVDLV